MGCSAEKEEEELSKTLPSNYVSKHEAKALPVPN
jgi:hypothetical protein